MEDEKSKNNLIPSEYWIREMSSLELVDAVEAYSAVSNTDEIFARYTAEPLDGNLLLAHAIERATITNADADVNKSIILHWVDDERKAIATVASFILVSGKTKVGKTNALIWIVSALFGREGLPYKSKLLNDAEALWVDTEQSRGHIASVGSVFAKQFGLDSSFHPRLKLISLRSYSPRARWRLITQFLRTNSRIRILVIDNLADLVHSVLDEREANEFFNTLTRLIEARGLLVIGVIHRNKTNAHSKGHLGTMGEQRAETVLDIDRDGDVVSVEAKLTRNAPVPTVSYTFNDGVFNFLEVEERQKAAAKKNFDNIPVEDHLRVLREVFKNDPQLYPGQFKEVLRSIYSEMVTPIGLELVKKLQAFYVQQGMITKVSGKMQLKDEMDGMAAALP